MDHSAIPAAPAAQAAAGGGVGETSIRVAVNVLDRLMNLAGELVLSRNQLLQTLASSDRSALGPVAARVNQVTSELQETIMQTRLQSIGTIFGRFPRVVRDLSNTLGKHCQLTIEGQEVELDKSIIEAVGDPLTHLIRNAVDHGIEPPEARLKAKKPAVGTLALRAFHQAGKVKIQISDDGRGIDAARLKEKAVAKGLLTAEQARAMSDREALQLIFRPGFSMAERGHGSQRPRRGHGRGQDQHRAPRRLGGDRYPAGQGDHDRRQTAADPGQSSPRWWSVRAWRPLRHSPGEHPGTGPRQGRGGRRADRKGSNMPEVFRLRGALLPLIRLNNSLALRESNDEVTAARAVHIIVVEAGPSSLRPDRRRPVRLGGDRGQAPGPPHEGLLVPGGSNHPRRRPRGLDSRHRRNRLLQPARHSRRRTRLRRPPPRRPRPTTNRLCCCSPITPRSTSGFPWNWWPGWSGFGRIRSTAVGGQQILQYRGGTLPLLSLEQTIACKPREECDKIHVIVFTAADREIGLLVPQLLDIRSVAADIDTATLREAGDPRLAGPREDDGPAWSTSTR